MSVPLQGGRLSCGWSLRRMLLFDRLARWKPAFCGKISPVVAHLFDVTANLSHAHNIGLPCNNLTVADEDKQIDRTDVCCIKSVTREMRGVHVRTYYSAMLSVMACQFSFHVVYCDPSRHILWLATRCQCLELHRRTHTVREVGARHRDIEADRDESLGCCCCCCCCCNCCL